MNRSQLIGLAGILTLGVALLALAVINVPGVSGSSDCENPLACQTSTPEPNLAKAAGEQKIYLPFMPQRFNVNDPTQVPDPVDGGDDGSIPLIHLPYFSDSVKFPETAIFWFGQISSSENYADVRLGYSQQELYIHVAVFDHYLWYDKSPSADSFSQWDSVALNLSLSGNQGNTLSPSTYRFASALNWDGGRDDFQAAYQGQAADWLQINVPFTTESMWRGGGMNDNENGDRGWTITYHIPFTSLGLSGPPAEGTNWGLAVELFDRDDTASGPNPVKRWPSGLDGARPETWGQISFGLPAYTVPNATPGETVTIQNKLNGAVVTDGEVGGGTNCGKDLDFWTVWGNTTTPGSDKNQDFNIQNQHDVGDWPCFSKYYVTFPLDSIPGGKSILSAKLTLHLFGNSGGGKWGPPPDSLIQVFTSKGSWNENTLTWNKAPQVKENVGQAWVEGVTSFPGWPGVPYTWDLSRAVAQAYAAGEPLRLILYSSDGEYHSGKYFVSSDAPDWNTKARPRLDIQWGTP